MKICPDIQKAVQVNAIKKLHTCLSKVQTHSTTHTAQGTDFFPYLFAYLTQIENGSRGQYSALDSGPLISNHSFVMFTGKSATIHMTKSAAEKMNSCHHVMC